MSGAPGPAPAVAAIVLAAGRGVRFGPDPKLLAQWQGRALVSHVAEAALGSRADPVIAVMGAHAERVGAALAGLSVETTFNPRFADGLSTSLQAGFRALPAGAAAAVVLLGDMPLVSPGLVDALIAAWHERRPAAVVPTVAGRRGNPVLLARTLEPEIMALRGDRGAGPLLAARTDVLEVPIEDSGALVDVDTSEALADLAAGRLSDRRPAPP